MIARVGCLIMAGLAGLIAAALAAPILAAGGAIGLALAGEGAGWAFALLGAGGGLAVVILAGGVVFAEIEGRRLDALIRATDRQYFCPGCGRRQLPGGEEWRYPAGGDIITLSAYTDRGG